MFTERMCDFVFIYFFGSCYSPIHVYTVIHKPIYLCLKDIFFTLGYSNKSCSIVHKWFTG